MNLDLRDKLVRFILRHLPAANHELNQITRAFHHKTRQASGSIDDILHCCSHLAARLETYFVRFCRHFSNCILYIRTPVTGAPPRRRRRILGKRNHFWLFAFNGDGHDCFRHGRNGSGSGLGWVFALGHYKLLINAIGIVTARFPEA